MLRSLLGLLVVGGAIGFVVGLVNLGDQLQIGGASGYIFEGAHVVLGSALVVVGALLLAGGVGAYQQFGAITPAVPIGVVLLATAGIMFVTLGKTPEEVCGLPFCP